MKRMILTLLVCLQMALAANAQQLYLGGDISLLPTYEKAGTVYRDTDGKAMPPLELFRRHKWNAMRVRLFVDPQNAPQENRNEGVCQDLPYVIDLCRSIKQAGFAVMLDFHYSDTWADPGKQFTPSRWTNADPATLPDSVYTYTTYCLRAMKEAGVEPDMIQVGNEISFGMLWPAGKTDPLDDANWDYFASLLRSGAAACRKECPRAKLIIHTEQAGKWNNTKGFYERLRARDVDYDIIGLSYYPMWHERIPVLSATLDSLAALFPEKEVMIVEAAFYYSHDNDRWAKGADQYSEFYPISAEGQRVFTRELVTELRRHRNVTGLFWWFPEENACGNDVLKCWINRGLFDNHTGRALPAITELEGFLK